MKDEVFTQRSLLRKLNFEQIQMRLFIVKNYNIIMAVFKNGQSL